MPEGQTNHRLKPQNRGVRIQSRTGKDAHTAETILQLKKKKSDEPSAGCEGSLSLGKDVFQVQGSFLKALAERVC